MSPACKQTIQVQHSEPMPVPVVKAVVSSEDHKARQKPNICGQHVAHCIIEAGQSEQHCVSSASRYFQDLPHSGECQARGKVFRCQSSKNTNILKAPPSETWQVGPRRQMGAAPTGMFSLAGEEDKQHAVALRAQLEPVLIPNYVKGHIWHTLD